MYRYQPNDHFGPQHIKTNVMLHGNTSGLVLKMHYFVKPVLVGVLRLSVFLVVSWPPFCWYGYIFKCMPMDPTSDLVATLTCISLMDWSLVFVISWTHCGSAGDILTVCVVCDLFLSSTAVGCWLILCNNILCLLGVIWVYYNNSRI